MIKLHTTRTQEFPGGGHKGWAGSFADMKHDAQVAHAYQEASGGVKELWLEREASATKRIVLDTLDAINKRAAEKLKSWGVEP